MRAISKKLNIKIKYRILKQRGRPLPRKTQTRKKKSTQNRSKTNHINNYIKYKGSKTSMKRWKLSDFKRQIKHRTQLYAIYKKLTLNIINMYR